MAAMTQERQAALLAYCKLEELSDDPAAMALLDGFRQAAEGYLSGAGIAQPTEGHRLAMYDLAVNAMVLDFWDHRDLKEPTSQVAENTSLRRLINQLKLTEEEVGF